MGRWWWTWWSCLGIWSCLSSSKLREQGGVWRWRSCLGILKCWSGPIVELVVRAWKSSWSASWNGVKVRLSNSIRVLDKRRVNVDVCSRNRVLGSVLRGERQSGEYRGPSVSQRSR